MYLQIKTCGMDLSFDKIKHLFKKNRWLEKQTVRTFTSFWQSISFLLVIFSLDLMELNLFYMLM